MINNKTVAVIILNYNDWITTKSLVDSIKGYNSLDHIVVVDNHSSDSSFENLKSLSGHRISVISTEKNGGYSYGNNVGIKYAIDHWHPDITVIANPDVEFTESFIYQIVSCIGIENIFAASGITLSANGDVQMLGGSVNTYFDDLFDCLYITKKLFGKKETSTKRSGKEYVEVGLLSGSLFAIDTNKFLEIGLFDENIFLYCEERIIGKKFRDNNWKMVVNQNASYIHHHAVSTSKQFDSYNMMKLVFKSRMYYQETYNHIGAFKKHLLKAFMTIGLFERKIYRMVKQRGH